MLFFIFFLVVFLPESVQARPFVKKRESHKLVKFSKSNPHKKSLKKGLYLKPFPVIYRPEVERWILVFSQDINYLKLWLSRSYRYFPMMKKIFTYRGLPKELLSMSLVESSLSSKAVSSAQAVGYWQFIKPTGLEFGLQINHWIDERRDFQKSTEAAARYLYYLYEEFEDWLLSMSAYNMGETRLRALIKKHGTKDFWILYKKPDFPKETALYIPKVLAASHLFRRPELYGLKSFSVLSPYQYDVFFTPGGTNLRKMFLAVNASIKKLKILNPDLKSYIIPKNIAFHQVRVPKGSGLLVSKWLDKQKESH